MLGIYSWRTCFNYIHVVLDLLPCSSSRATWLPQLFTRCYEACSMRSSWTSGKSSSKCDPVCHWLRRKPWPLEDLKFSLMAGCTGIEAIEIALETKRSATAGCQKQHRKWTSVSNLTDPGKLEKCRLGTCLQFCTGNVVVTRALKRQDSTMNYAQQPHANSVC